MSVDGRYDYTKPWVYNPESYANAGVESQIQPGATAPNFDENAALNPNSIWSNPPRWAYNGPFASNMERLTQQALMAATMPGVQLQEMVRPPIPQIRLFPDRFGFGERSQPDIYDVISLDRVYMEPRVSWYSGSPAGYSGSSRNDLGSV